VLGGGAATVVSRVVVVVVSGSLAQEISIIASTESTEVRMIDFFHSVNYFFTNNSSQIALPDVSKKKNPKTEPVMAEIRSVLQDVSFCPLHVDLLTLFL